MSSFSVRKILTLWHNIALWIYKDQRQYWDPRSGRGGGGGRLGSRGKGGGGQGKGAHVGVWCGWVFVHLLVCFAALHISLIYTCKLNHISRTCWPITSPTLQNKFDCHTYILQFKHLFDTVLSSPILLCPDIIFLVACAHKIKRLFIPSLPLRSCILPQ